MKKAILVAVLVGAFVSPALGQYEGTIVFQGGHGAKALGMGGAYVALADDASAVLWNPAGLTLAQGAWLGGATSNWFGMVPVQFVSGGLTWREFAFGLGWGSATADLYSANMFLGSVGYTFGPLGSLGANIKYYREAIKGYEPAESGFGLDLGFLFTVTDWASVGIMAQDVIGMGMAEGQTVVPTYKAGVAMTFLDEAITLAADAGLVGLEFSDLRMGMEVVVIEALTIRAGIAVPQMEWDRYYFSVGAGLQLAGLTVDVAYVLRGEPGESLVLSAAFSFGELFAPPAEGITQ